MKRIQVERREVDVKRMKLAPAEEKDFSVLVDEPALVCQGDEILVVYVPNFQEDTTEVVAALKAIRYQKSYRTKGLKTTSRIFGFQPRNSIRKDFCATAKLARESPAEHAVICQWGSRVSVRYRELNPERYARQLELLGRVRPEWRLPDSVFTSGIINWNNSLRYHHDFGNFHDVWSCMLVFAYDTEGGSLSVPELGLGFAFPATSLIMFDGQALLHGVTPIRKKSRGAYRYSIVYYALEQMCHCLSKAEELDRIRKLKTVREVRRKEGKSPHE